ncbi:putative TATA-box binding protein [Paratrimastix pyriformis]|uniref:TATA-box binding protein n=1 Tax=Paratrimastix pyriformis TaxID=342808 RepID=A0ABQ8UDY5_9EUKA|nr:putative TATA-box binding protein [Paratrimastix pyriformis]
MSNEPFHLLNVVSAFNAGTHLDLNSIIQKIPMAEYNPKRFPAVILRLKEPKSMAFIFANGRIVIVGPKNEMDSRSAASKCANVLTRKLAPQIIQFSEFRLQNMVAESNLGFPVHLEAFACVHAHTTTYDPECFPGCLYRMPEARARIMVFRSGKVVLTKARSREEIKWVLERLNTILAPFRIVDAAAPTTAAPTTAAPTTAAPTTAAPTMAAPTMAAPTMAAPTDSAGPAPTPSQAPTLAPLTTPAVAPAPVVPAMPPPPPVGQGQGTGDGPDLELDMMPDLEFDMH